MRLQEKQAPKRPRRQHETTSRKLISTKGRLRSSDTSKKCPQRTKRFRSHFLLFQSPSLPQRNKFTVSRETSVCSKSKVLFRRWLYTSGLPCRTTATITLPLPPIISLSYYLNHMSLANSNNNNNNNINITTNYVNINNINYVVIAHMHVVVQFYITSIWYFPLFYIHCHILTYSGTKGNTKLYQG